MSIELGSLQLTKIHHIQTLEDAGFVYQKIPGTAGEVVQDLGRAVVRLSIQGIFYGDQRQQQMAKLREIYLQRKPVDFVADTTDQTYASQVTVESLTVEEQARYQQQLGFQMVVREYIKQPSKADAAQNKKINQKIKLKAKKTMAINSLPDALAMGSMPEISNPFTPLNDAMTPIAEAGSDLSSAMKSLDSIL